MPSPATLLLIAALLPLLSFAVLTLVGRRMGEPWAGYLATLAVGASLGCALAAMLYWFNGGTYTAPGGLRLRYGPGMYPINLACKWVPAGPGFGQDHPGWLDVGLYVDSLTIALANMVTLVATLVHVFSIAYMRRDPKFSRYFAYLGLFCFSMLGLVIGSTLLQLLVFWELVGLCSYLLIGFWSEKRSAANAATKAFVVNRIGDLGLLIGLGILFYHVGNLSLPQLWVALGGAGAVDGVRVTGLTFPAAAPGGGVTFISATLLTTAGVCLFCGAMGKSAQFPLHVWLPDAMEGPTPASALIHAATMVAAGVYLVARIFPILTPDAKLFVAVTGVVTLTVGALVATVQSDIKRVLAYSTVSQLGYMMLAMGVGSWVGGLFHLVTHAFFKSLLFLGAGSVISAARHEQELGQFGGLARKIPLTAATFLVAVLAIAGTPFFSGYYSKELILSHAGAFASLARAQGWGPGVWLLFWLPTGAAYLTAFYMMRCWMLTFWGKPRNAKLYDRARERPGMVFPLVVLAVLSVIAGQFLNVEPMLNRAKAEEQHYVDAARPADAGAAAARDGTPARGADGGVFAQTWSVADPEPPVADATGGADAPAAADPPDVAPATTAPAAGDAADSPFLAAGKRLARRWAAWAFVVGIVLAAAVYARGYAVADRLMRLPPVRWTHGWLYHQMSFDELYYTVFVSTVTGLSAFVAVVDRVFVDGIVNLVGGSARGLAWAAATADRYVVDAAVGGVAEAAQGLGTAARAPQTGRIRFYVMALLAALTLACAVIAFVVRFHR